MFRRKTESLFICVIAFAAAVSVGAGCGDGGAAEAEAKKREDAKKIAEKYLDDARFWAKSASKTLQDELEKHAEFIKGAAADGLVMEDPTVDIGKKAVLSRVSTATENLNKAEEIAIQNNLADIIDSCKKLRGNINLIKSSADVLSP